MQFHTKRFDLQLTEDEERESDNEDTLGDVSDGVRDRVDLL